VISYKQAMGSIMKINKYSSQGFNPTNANILLATTAVFTQELDNTILTLQTRLTTLENRLANYENHTHSYVDDTINDTSDGSGTTTSTTKTTGIVS